MSKIFRDYKKVCHKSLPAKQEPGAWYRSIPAPLRDRESSARMHTREQSWLGISTLICLIGSAIESHKLYHKKNLILIGKCVFTIQKVKMKSLVWGQLHPNQGFCFS